MFLSYAGVWEGPETFDIMVEKFKEKSQEKNSAKALKLLECNEKA